MKQPIRKWLRGALAGLCLLTVLAGSCLLMPLADEEDTPTPDTGTDSPEPGVPADDGFQQVASRAGLTLYVHPTEGRIRVTDASGSVWDSTPADYETDEGVSGDGRMAMASLLSISYLDSLGNETSLNSYPASVRKDGYSFRTVQDGAELTFSFPQRGIAVTLVLTLTDEGLQVQVDNDRIAETDVYRLTTVTLLPFFGAARREQEGYLLVPDGSGALIDWSSPDCQAVTYSQYIYGRDAAVNSTTMSTPSETVRLPVFGLRKDETGFLAVVTDGAARGTVNAELCGRRSSYSGVSTSFIYRDAALVLVEKKNQTVRLAEEHPSTVDYTVLYTFLQGEESTYTGMANRYRRHLQEQGGIEPSGNIAEKSQALYLQVIGGVTRTENLLGFPVERVTALTRYEDCQTMLETLRSGGVGHLVLDYRYWANNADTASLTSSLSTESRLGSKQALRSLLDYCLGSGVESYLEVNVTDMITDAFPYQHLFQGARAVEKSPAMKYTYRCEDLKALQTSATFLLAPTRMETLAAKLAKSAADWSVTGLSSRGLTDQLYSDFGSAGISRDESERIWQETLAALGSTGKTLLASGSNAYALASASRITDTPMEHSFYRAETQAVPFYQIALHGLRPMATQPINTQNDTRRALLYAAETGISLNYRVTWNAADLLKDSALSDLRVSQFSDWQAQILADAARLAPLLAQVGDRSIVSHEALTEQLHKTVFSGGITVYTNYSDEAVQADGHTVPAQDFLVIGGAA